MKAVLTDERFSDPGWIFERKLDGIRCLAFKAEQRVRLRSRNDLSLNGRFPEIVAALEQDPVTDVVLDGEIVAFDGARTSFARLQQRGERPTPAFFYVFDILHVAGVDVTEEPLRARKALLRRSLGFADPIRMTAHPRADEGPLRVRLRRLPAAPSDGPDRVPLPGGRVAPQRDRARRPRAAATARRNERLS